MNRPLTHGSDRIFGVGQTPGDVRRLKRRRQLSEHIPKRHCRSFAARIRGDVELDQQVRELDGFAQAPFLRVVYS